MSDIQQSLRQASVRAVTGTTHTYEGDWHALFTSLGIAAGDFNGRMLQYINTRLSASYTEINGAMAAMAAAEGVNSFQSIGTFTPNNSNPPVNTVAPVISGNVQVGQTLSTTDGTWTGDATITFTYQWKRDGSSIGSATASTYVLVELDAGADITCIVTGTNGAGNSTGTSNALVIDVYVVYLASIVDATGDGVTTTGSYSGGAWNAASMGVAAANRKLLAIFFSLNTAALPSVSSSSWGGTAGSEAGAVEQNPGLGIWAWEFAVTAGTSGNLSVTFTDNRQLRAGGRLYAIYGAGAAAVVTNSATTGSDTTVANASVVTPANGKTISGFVSRSSTAGTTITWTNATEDSTGESALEGTGTWVSSAVTGPGTVNISALASVAAAGVFIASVTYGPS